MAKKSSINAKIRPLAHASLEKASLAGAARAYISKESLLALTHSLEHGKRCVVERVGDGARREAALWLLPDKNVGANVVMMTRAFQEAAGFRIGDQVSVSLTEPPAVPDADEVAVRGLSDEAPAVDARHAPGWEFCVSLSLDRAEHVFPGMVLEGVNINKLRRSFRVVSVNAQTGNVARFRLASTTVRMLGPDEAEAPAAAGSRGRLVVGGVPGLAAQVEAVNGFLRGFGRPLWVPGERESCALVIHGGHGTGKTLLLRRLEETHWGRAFWLRPSDKLSTVRETFGQARGAQPSLVLLDGLGELVGRDRANRDAIIDALADELDGLASDAARCGALPSVVVVATCLDHMTDVPARLQKRSRFRENVALPIPRVAERLDILTWLDPPLCPRDREQCLASIARRTHAFTGDDLACLVLNAKRLLGDRLDRQASEAEADASPSPDSSSARFSLTPDDMEAALRCTRPTAMHDVNLKPPTIHWQDVGGQESLKCVLSRMIRNARDARPAARRVLRHPPKGLLLYGPPGCSKTLSAQAMATESGFNFFAVKGAELLNMYVGESERAVRTLFERARAAAPSIIFFDEMDAIAGHRAAAAAATGSSASRTGAVNMLTTLLTEMDGFETLTGVLVLAATNRPEAMDPALLRPGRFDQVLYVGPPDGPAREAVFSVHLRGLSVAPDVDVPALARLTHGYSGAEIKAICTEAGLMVLDRLDDDAAAADASPLHIAMADLVAAIDKTPRNITSAMIQGYDAWRRQFAKSP